MFNGKSWWNWASNDKQKEYIAGNNHNEVRSFKTLYTLTSPLIWSDLILLIQPNILLGLCINTKAETEAVGSVSAQQEANKRKDINSYKGLLSDLRIKMSDNLKLRVKSIQSLEQTLATGMRANSFAMRGNLSRTLWR